MCRSRCRGAVDPLTVWFVCGLLVFAVLSVIALMWGIPTYRVWERGLSGKAELAKAAESKLAKQAQERIASGADLVGVGAGVPAKADSGSIDEILDSIFG